MAPGPPPSTVGAPERSCKAQEHGELQSMGTLEHRNTRARDVAKHRRTGKFKAWEHGSMETREQGILQSTGERELQSMGTREHGNKTARDAAKYRRTGYFKAWEHESTGTR